MPHHYTRRAATLRTNSDGTPFEEHHRPRIPDHLILFRSGSSPTTGATNGTHLLPSDVRPTRSTPAIAKDVELRQLHRSTRSEPMDHPDYVPHFENRPSATAKQRHRSNLRAPPKNHDTANEPINRKGDATNNRHPCTGAAPREPHQQWPVQSATTTSSTKAPTLDGDFAIEPTVFSAMR